MSLRTTVVISGNTGPVKEQYLIIILWCLFPYFSLNLCCEALLISTHNIYIYEEMEKIIPEPLV